MNFAIVEWYSMFNYDRFVIIVGGVYAYSGYTYYNDIFVIDTISGNVTYDSDIL